MRLDDCQRFLKKRVFNLDGKWGYYHHPSPQAALHFRTYIEHSKEVPAASNLGDGAPNYYVLVGPSLSQQNILKACATVTASVFFRHGDMTDASIATLKSQEYLFSANEMDLHCAFRLRAPSLEQQRIHAEENMTLFRFHLGRSFAPHEAVDLRALLFALVL